MALDHSQTYKKITIRNVAHIMRANSIKRTIKKLNLEGINTYYDIGCSNGYLTHEVAKLISAHNVVGWDHSKENLENGRENYPDITFNHIDLNKKNSFGEKAQFITCFETIEHVGDINAAIHNIEAMLEAGGSILYTVPIESGLLGYLKYLIKTKVFNYTLNEISEDKAVWKEYEAELFRGGDISKFREKRVGWATHFGFDYRNFEKGLGKFYKDIKSWTVGTSRFILINKVLS